MIDVCLLNYAAKMNKKSGGGSGEYALSYFKIADTYYNQREYVVAMLVHKKSLRLDCLWQRMEKVSQALS